MRKLSPGEVSNLATVTELVNGRKGTRILIYLMPKPKVLAILLPVSCQLSLFPTSKSSTKAPHYDLHMTNTQKIKAEFKIPNSFIQEAATENKEWKTHTEASPLHPYPSLPKFNPPCLCELGTAISRALTMQLALPHFSLCISP